MTRICFQLLSFNYRSDVPPLSEKVDDYFYNDEIILPLEDGIEPIQDVLMESTF